MRDVDEMMQEKLDNDEAAFYQRQDALAALERRGVITTDPDEAEECCGQKRDADGFCQHRQGHPIYVKRHDA